MIGMLGASLGLAELPSCHRNATCASCHCHVCFPPSERSLPSSADAAHPNNGEWAQACKPHLGKVDRYPGRRFYQLGLGIS